MDESENKAEDMTAKAPEEAEKKAPVREKKHTWKFFLGLFLGVILALFAVVLIKGMFVVQLPGIGQATITLPTYYVFHKADPGKLDYETIERKLKEIEFYLDGEYYYDADKAEVTEGVYRGMVEALSEQDPYSRYYTRQEFTDELNTIGGTYVGIGVTVSIEEGTKGLLVEAVTPGGPAEAAGVRNKDIIIRADDVDLRGMELAEATADHIKGEEGTSVKIEVLRNGEPLTFTIERRKLDDKTVYWSTFSMDGKKYGYIFVRQFEGTTWNGFREAIDAMEKEDIAGTVIDLRSDPGGDMNVALDMLDYILPDDNGTYTDVEGSPYRGKTLLLTIESKSGLPVSYYAKDGHSSSLDLVILADEGSASASEIFTGVMRSYGYRSAGVTTFGKGIVQSVRMLYDSSGVKYTSGEYVLPNGDRIHGIGIAPDLEVKPTEELEENGIDISAPDPKLDNQLAAAAKMFTR